MNEALAKALFEAQCSGFDSEHCASLSRTLHSAVFPLLDVSFDAAGMVPLRLKIDGSRFNAEAPKVLLCSPDGVTLTKLPRTGGIFNSEHPKTRLPFICMAGTDEYHTHPNHLTDRWDRLRQDRTLSSIVYQIQEGWWTTWRA